MKRIFIILFIGLFIHISSFANWQGAGYYRVQGDYYKRYISVIGSEFSESTNPDAFQYCIKMDSVQNIFTNPGTVIYINSLTNSPSLQSQGENTRDLITYDFKFKTNPDGTIEAYYSTWFFITITAYLQDYNTGIDVGQNETYAKFNLLPLDNESNYFAVEPAIEYNGYYYTTLRVAFNYTLPENVYAYIIQNGNLKLYASPNQTVPKNYPVILKCKSSEKEQNKLLPTTGSALPAIINDLKKAVEYHKYTIHKGQFKNGSGNDANNMTVQVNQGDKKDETNSSYRVLGVKDGKLGFYENFWNEQARIHGTENAVKCLDGNRVYWTVSNEDANGGTTLLESPTITPATSEYEAGESVTFNVSSEATKTGATIQYKIDNGEWQTYNGANTLTSDENATADVTRTISVRTVNAGIESDESTATYTFIAPRNIHIADLPSNPDGFSYKIIDDPLTVAYVDKNNVVYAKDKNGASVQNPGEDETDFMKEHYKDGTHADHSNWVAIEVASEPSVETYNTIDAIGKVKEGSFPNRRIVGRVKKLDANNFFSYNTYCVVNFMDKTFHKGYFFASPAANEVANIIWAQYADKNTFIAPPSSTFDGGFTADFSLYKGNVPTLIPGHVYGFLALIEKTATTASGISPKATMTSGYKVYPLEEMKDWSNTVTGVTTVQATGNVVSVKYYNAMGVESSVPFKGVNIVVTTYDNGTRSTSKMIR